LFQGFGKLQCNCGPLLSYEGEFERGKLHGKGTARFRNGDFYEGHFKENQVRALVMNTIQ
jgi:hypothetical protein